MPSGAAISMSTLSTFKFGRLSSASSIFCTVIFLSVFTVCVVFSGVPAILYHLMPLRLWSAMYLYL